MVLLGGEEFQRGTGKSPFDVEFWHDNGVIWASTKDRIKINQNMAESLGVYVKKTFQRGAEVRGYLVEWNEQTGQVVQVGTCKTILGLEPKKDVSWREVWDTNIKSTVKGEIRMAEVR